MKNILYILALILLFISFKNISDSLVLKVLPIILMSMILFTELLTYRLMILFNKKLIIVFILVLTIIVGILSSQREDINVLYKSFKTITFFLTIVATIRVVFNTLKKESFLNVFLKLLYVPFLIYVILNLISFLLGFKGEDYLITSDAMVLSYFGLNIGRVNFFLSQGINGYGTLVGILFVLSIIGVFVIRKNKTLFLTGIIAASVTLLLTDSRGAIVFSLIIFLIVKFYFNKTSKPKFLYLVPLIGFFGPFLLTFTLTYLSSTDYAENISRSSEDLASGNSRLFIWGLAVNDFLEFKPEHHVFGYGEYGHYTSGISPEWGFIFGDKDDVDYIHPHNTFLSILFDYGYFGLLIYLIFQYTVINIIKKYWNKYRDLVVLLLANLLYFNLVGIVETMFGFYYENVIYIFLLFNIFAFMLKFEESIKFIKNEI